MRLSQSFIQTLREASSEARTPGYQHLLRAGYLRPLAGGSLAPSQRDLAFLPLGQRLRERVEQAVCQALGTGCAQPIALPSTRIPAATRPSTSRETIAQRGLALQTGHETLVLALAAGVIRSYRQLPIWLSETWQYLRDDEWSAGGLLGMQEGRVLDCYGLHAEAAGLAAGYAQTHDALLRLSRSWDLSVLDVISAETAEKTAMGHRLVLPWTGGEEVFAHCSHCGYAADQGVAHTSQQVHLDEELQPMQDVVTPDCKTIAELARFLGVPVARTAKAIFLVAYNAAQGDRFVFAVVRGDTALNEDKLKAALGVETVGPATEAEIRQAGAEPGYGSPVGLFGATVVVDTLAARSPNLVMGANQPGYHTLNVNYGRDYQATLVADIATAQAGSPCAACGSPLTIEHGVALAEMLQVGAVFSLSANATYLDVAGHSQPLLLSTVRVHIDRFVAALAERYHDSHGLAWPAPLAPYQVYLMNLGKASPELSEVTLRIYDDLTAAGFAVLFDDRDERAGVKFNDADLLGFPLRVALGDRGLQSGTVEVKRRGRSEFESVAIGQLAAYVAEALTSSA
jgi:prolyl-tRNA synthetase